MRILGTAVRDGQGRTATHLEHAAGTGHPQCTAVQVEGQGLAGYDQSFGDRRIGVQGNGRVVRRSVDFCLQVRQRRAGGAHQGICYIPRCNKSCPYGQRAYQYQGHQDGEQSSLHGGSSFYGSHISLPGLCAVKFLVGKVLRRAGSVVRPSYQKVSRKATGISRCWHNKSAYQPLTKLISSKDTSSLAFPLRAPQCAPRSKCPWGTHWGCAQLKVPPQGADGVSRPQAAPPYPAASAATHQSRPRGGFGAI